MVYVIGVDEAGYGPRIGPLVIAATVWRVLSRASAEQMTEVVRRAVARLTTGDEPQLLHLEDSKQVYRSGHLGLKRLELTVQGAWRYMGDFVPTWRELWTRVTTWNDRSWLKAPWYDNYDEPLPVAVNGSLIDQAAAHWRQLTQIAPVGLRAVKIAAIFPGQFNAWLEHQNKAQMLTERSLLLLAECLRNDVAGDDELLVVCDRHGGRRFYGAAVQHLLQTAMLVVVEETQQKSVYRATLADGRRLEITFQVGADETNVAVSLASMVAKYVRELAMRAFNKFWQHQIPGTEPTAGYGTDAERFYRHIAPACQTMQIAIDNFWRRQ